jgi:hypothetical protein
VRALPAALAFCLALTLVGCGKPHPTLKELKKSAPAKITYPGSVKVHVDGRDSSHSFLGGDRLAHYEALYTVNANPQDVAAWYDQQLRDLKMIEDDTMRVSPTGPADQVWAWRTADNRRALVLIAPDESATRLLLAAYPALIQGTFIFKVQL